MSISSMRGPNTAIEAGAPMARMRSDNKRIPFGVGKMAEVNEGKIAESTDLQAINNSLSELPHSGLVHNKRDANVYAKKQGGKAVRDRCILLRSRGARLARHMALVGQAVSDHVAFGKFLASKASRDLDRPIEQWSSMSHQSTVELK